MWPMKYSNSSNSTSSRSTSTRRIVCNNVILDPDPYTDPKPPRCNACWGIRQITHGQKKLCRWCAGNAIPYMLQKLKDARRY